MKSTKFLICVMLILVGISGFNSCNNDTEDNINNVKSAYDQEVVVSSSEYKNAPNDPVLIAKMKITEDCLHISFGASGCDGSTWEVQLIDAGTIAESYPVQRTLRLSLKNNEDCTAALGKEMSFSIKSLQVAGENKVSLNISGKHILYEY